MINYKLKFALILCFLLVNCSNETNKNISNNDTCINKIQELGLSSSSLISKCKKIEEKYIFIEKWVSFSGNNNLLLNVFNSTTDECFSYSCEIQILNTNKEIELNIINDDLVLSYETNEKIKLTSSIEIHDLSQNKIDLFFRKFHSNIIQNRLPYENSKKARLKYYWDKND